MRQILSGFLATAMIVSVASAMTFAASSAASITVTTTAGKLELADGAITSGDTVASGNWSIDVKYGTFKIPVTGAEGKTVDIEIPLNKTETLTPATDPTPSAAKLEYADIDLTTAKLANLLDGQSIGSVLIDGAVYTGKISASGSTITVKFDQKVQIPAITLGTPTLDVTASNVKTNVVLNLNGGGTGDGPAVVMTDVQTTGYTFTATADRGSGDQNSDVEKTGDFFKSLDITKVIRCYGTGDPIPMTEKGVGVDKDLNDQGGVQSGKTLYFMINDETETTFNDDTYWKLKITKGDNAKLIKKITDTTKIFSGALVDANTGASIPGIDFTKRHRYIKVEMNEIFTDDEYKCTLDLRLTPTSKAESKFANQGVDGSEIKIKDFYFWVKNIVKTADNDWKVGVGGLMLNPLENDWNEVTYYDEDGDLAFMKFFADSDVSKFYAKLSTKWEHADYASYFNDQDAYIFDFVGSPKISATSRCDLQIYNPFVNEDGDETIDPSTAVIYQVIDGDLFDVTDSFKYEEGDNGDMAYTTRTRFLGTYIICERAVEEAVDDSADVPADLVPEDTTPSEVTPGNNGGGKAPANTGKYL